MTFVDARFASAGGAAGEQDIDGNAEGEEDAHKPIGLEANKAVVGIVGFERADLPG